MVYAINYLCLVIKLNLILNLQNLLYKGIEFKSLNNKIVRIYMIKLVNILFNTFSLPYL